MFPTVHCRSMAWAIEGVRSSGRSYAKRRAVLAAATQSLEMLEPRRLLAASISLGSDRILKIVGTDSAEIITVTPVGSGMFHVVNGKLTKDVSEFSVKGISIDARAGNDTVTLSVATPSTVAGGSGNDKISGAHGIITAGDGNDTIVSSDGSLDGGAGNDSITAGTRTQNGFFFQSEISGDAGNDTLTGAGGNDFLTGGAGNDVLVGHAGNDSLDGGTGTDYMEGDEGADQVSYADRSDNLSLSLDNKNNDGAPGEKDFLSSDIETILGGSGNDSITGNDQPNYLDGHGGRDTVKGLGGNDTLYAETGGADGGAGDDTFLGGAVDYSSRTEPITINFTGPGNVVSHGTGIGGAAGETDTYYNGTSFDFFHTAFTAFYLGSGNDNVVIKTSENGGSPNITVLGNGGSDTITETGNGGATLDGGSGNDTITSSSRFTDIRGGTGADHMNFADFSATPDNDFAILDYSDHTTPVNVSLDGVNNDGSAGEGDIYTGTVRSVIGGSGNDTITGNEHANSLFGGGGNDTINGAGGEDQLFGEAGDDSLVGGGDAGDLITGGSGNDTIIGSGGNDVLLGGSNTLEDTSTDGNDSIVGGDGGDEISGNNGNDTLSGGAGADSFFGSAGSDDVSGGGGNDTIAYDSISKALKLSLDNVANDGAAGEKGNIHSDIENITGGSGADVITGGPFDNSLIGGGGNDTIFGGGGNDSLDGGDGNDALYGQAGNDTMTGGHGVDAFFGDIGDDIFFARDGNRETIDGGAGNDKVNRDYTAPHDDVLKNVESTF